MNNFPSTPHLRSVILSCVIKKYVEDCGIVWKCEKVQVVWMLLHYAMLNACKARVFHTDLLDILQFHFMT